MAPNKTKPYVNDEAKEFTIRGIYAEMNWYTRDLFGTTSLSISLILNLFPHSSYTNRVQQ